MKKFILAAITGVMLLSNAAFATVKTTNVNTGEIYTVSSSTPITVQSDDPGGW